jgi:hypothetical protein
LSVRRREETAALNRMRARLVAPAIEGTEELLNELNNLATRIALLPADEDETDPEIVRRLDSLRVRFAEWLLHRNRNSPTPVPPVRRRRIVDR